MQQPGLTIADLQSDAASSLIARSRDAVYKQRINIDSVIAEVDAEELAREIASMCGATEETGYSAGYGSGRLFTGEDKEITFSKFNPLPEASDERRKAIGHLRKLRRICTLSKCPRLTIMCRLEPRPRSCR